MVFCYGSLSGVRHCPSSWGIAGKSGSSLGPLTASDYEKNTSKYQWPHTGWYSGFLGNMCPGDWATDCPEGRSKQGEGGKRVERRRGRQLGQGEGAPQEDALKEPWNWHRSHSETAPRAWGQWAKTDHPVILTCLWYFGKITSLLWASASSYVKEGYCSSISESWNED